MDWKMPGMNGLETSRKIRLELHLTLPIIMMTAFAREVHKSEAEQAGTNGFLTKPIFQSTLFDAIMDAFGKEGTRRGGTRTDFTTRASMYKKHLKGCSILVAEDNYTNQLVARAILEGAGVQVRIVENGEEAVAAVKKENFDAVLMDIQMPKMNGYQATRQIRALPGCDDLPIIAMTAHAMKGDEEKCLEAGMDGYVAKPINQDRFFYTLWRRLRNRKRVTVNYVANGANAANNDADVDIEAARAITPMIEGGAMPEENGKLLSTPGRESGIPCRLPGVDVEGALQATGLDWRSYQEILVGFFQDNTDTAGIIQQALDEKDIKSLLHFAHRLKGSAANIGARDVQLAADMLEKQCSEGSMDSVAELTARLLVELDRVQRVLQPLAETNAETNAGTNAGTNEYDGEDSVAVLTAEDDVLKPLLALVEAIDRADPVEIHTITVETRKKLAGRKMVDQSLVKLLDTQIRRYDYDQALETIQQVRDALEEQG
jgi:CheY-like chemotaxis protein